MSHTGDRPLLHWMGRMLARFVGLVFVLYGLLLFIGNLFGLIGGDMSAPWWAFAWVLASGLLALAGGAIFILTFDGSRAWRTRPRRSIAVIMMILASFVPSTVGAIVFVFAVLAVPTIWAVKGKEAAASTDG